MIREEIEKRNLGFTLFDFPTSDCCLSSQPKVYKLIHLKFASFINGFISLHKLQKTHIYYHYPEKLKSVKIILEIYKSGRCMEMHLLNFAQKCRKLISSLD